VTEPTSASSLALVAAGVGLTAVLPGIDGNALVGAFAGGTLFVVSAPGLPFWRRLLYLAVSVVGGYMAAADLMAQLPITSSGLAAFIAAAVVVTITLAVIEKVAKLDFSFLRRGGPPSA